jgi:hypothetical protein
LNRIFPWKQLPLEEWALRATPAWAQETVRSWERELEPELGVFATAFRVATTVRRQSVDLRTVVGLHGDFHDSTWLALISPLHPQVAAAIREADENPTSYLRPEGRAEIQLVSCDGAQWFAETGGPQVVAAKFLHAYYQNSTGRHPLLHSAHTVQHHIDVPMLSRYLEVHRLILKSRLPIELRVLPGALLTIDGDRKHYEAPRVRVEDRRIEGARPDIRVLDGPGFGLYAAGVLKSDGQLRWQHRILIGLRQVLRFLRRADS